MGRKKTNFDAIQFCGVCRGKEKVWLCQHCDANFDSMWCLRINPNDTIIETCIDKMEKFKKEQIEKKAIEKMNLKLKRSERTKEKKEFLKNFQKQVDLKLIPEVPRFHNCNPNPVLKEND